MTTNKKPEDEIAKDGESVRVPMHLMDSVQKGVADGEYSNPKADDPKAQSNPPADTLRAAAEKARADQIKRMEQFWKGPWASQQTTTISGGSKAEAERASQGAQIDTSAAYEAANIRTSNAWRKRG